LLGNTARDVEQHQQLKQLGWHVMVVWECETSDAQRLARLARRIRQHPAL
jgi:DNA mismatch endonuclease (patch repair protein)